MLLTLLSNFNPLRSYAKEGEAGKLPTWIDDDAFLQQAKGLNPDVVGVVHTHTRGICA